eukprot:3932590-Rhodomonas_salina.1
MGGWRWSGGRRGSGCWTSVCRPSRAWRARSTPPGCATPAPTPPSPPTPTLSTPTTPPLPLPLPTPHSLRHRPQLRLPAATTPAPLHTRVCAEWC